MTSYVPINDLVFYAAHAGAISGMGVPGWITDPTKSDYLPQVTSAAAFAQAFDQVWNSTTTISVYEAEAITSVVATQFSLRGPGPLANPVYTTQANWLKSATACVALILESDAYFAGQGLIPPPFPTSGLLQTGYAQAQNVTLVYGAVIATPVVSVHGINVPANGRVIATFDGVAVPPSAEGSVTMGYSIGRGTSYDTIVRTTNLNSADIATAPFSYTYEYDLHQGEGNNQTFSGLAFLAAEGGATENMTISYASLQIQVVSV
jgi:hypothetical protein